MILSEPCHQILLNHFHVLTNFVNSLYYINNIYTSASLSFEWSVLSLSLFSVTMSHGSSWRVCNTCSSLSHGHSAMRIVSELGFGTSGAGHWPWGYKEVTTGIPDRGLRPQALLEIVQQPQAMELLWSPAQLMWTNGCCWYQVSRTAKSRSWFQQHQF